MTEVPEALARAMRAQGLVDPEVVAAMLAGGDDPIPPDEVVAAEERGDWRSQLADTEEDLSEQERAMIQPSLLEDDAGPTD